MVDVIGMLRPMSAGLDFIPITCKAYRAVRLHGFLWHDVSWTANLCGRHANLISSPFIPVYSEKFIIVDSVFLGFVAVNG